MMVSKCSDIYRPTNFVLNISKLTYTFVSIVIITYLKIN